MSRREFPERNDLVLGVIQEIRDHGVYITLYEYDDLRAYCHINEISSRWVRNIRNVVREGQRVVGRVMRVKPQHSQVDISLKKVSAERKRRKIKQWQHFTQALNLLAFVGEHLGKTLEETRDEIEGELVRVHETLYAALEAAAAKGLEAFEGVDFAEKWFAPIVEVAKKNITIPTVEIVEELELTCFEPNGVEVIAEALKAAIRTASRNQEVSVKAYTKGSPKYHLVIEAADWKMCELYLNRALDKIIARLDGVDASLTHQRFASN